MTIHRIHLRGPWNYEWLDDSRHDPKIGRVSLPKEWRELFGDVGGHVRFQRTFHCPTNLSETSRVDLVFEGIGGEAVVTLNGHMLGETDSENPLRLTITDHLRPTNDLQVELQFQPEKTPRPGGLWGLVVLEIAE